jgi:hypothetical protein
MAKTTEKKPTKLTLDNSYSAKQRTERCEIRCSKNFNTIIDAIINEAEYSKPSKADILHQAIKELAEKKGLLKIGDAYYV